jgi:hypothetical protein
MQGINSSNVADQFLWDRVADPKKTALVELTPYLIILTLPDERFEGKIKAHKRRRNHQSVPVLGLPKISTGASCIVRPDCLASQLWSIWANWYKINQF